MALVSFIFLNSLFMFNGFVRVALQNSNQILLNRVIIFCNNVTKLSYGSRSVPSGLTPNHFKIRVIQFRSIQLIQGFLKGVFVFLEF